MALLNRSDSIQIEPYTRPNHWYLLKTKPRLEETTHTVLTQRGIEVYLPQLLNRSKPRRELKPTPLFPGYLFFRLEANSNYWAYLRWATGVSYVLHDDSGPLVVPAELVETIRQRQTQNYQHVYEAASRPFEAGEKLKIVNGPLKGLEAVFEGRLSPAGRCHVLIEMLGQLARVQLKKDDLERIGS